MGVVESVAEAVAPSWLSIPLKLFGWAKSAGTWLVAHPVPALCLALAGTGFYGYHEHRLYLAERAAVSSLQNSYADAQAQAKAKADQDKAKNEAAIAQFAGVTNHDYEDGIADGRSSLAGWLRGQIAGSARRVPATPEDHAPGVPVQPPATAAVALTEEQLKGWDADYQYGVSCRAYVLDLVGMMDGKKTAP